MLGCKEVTVQYTNDKGVDVNHVAVVMPFGVDSTFVNLIDNPMPIGTARRIRFIVANSYLDAKEFQGSEVSLLMALPASL